MPERSFFHADYRGQAVFLSIFIHTESLLYWQKSAECAIVLRESKMKKILFAAAPLLILLFVSFAGRPPADPAYSENGSLYLGNPSGAVRDEQNHADNYLMIKNTYALSYNNAALQPNWVSWHLDASDLGDIKRQSDFRADDEIPDSWYAVKESDYGYKEYGFDRGHMCPSADRSKNVQDNSETFLMTNMVPQTPNNNRVVWRLLEEYERSLAAEGCELYIVCGQAGSGGSSDKGTFSEIPVPDSGRAIKIPSYVWKILLVLENGTDDLKRINADTRVIAVLIPNTVECAEKKWQDYSVSVDELEALTGYDFFSAVPDEIERQLED